MQLFNWKKFLLYAYYRLEKSARLLENIVHDYYIGWKEIYIRRRYNNLIKTKRNKNENILKIFLRVFFTISRVNLLKCKNIEFRAGNLILRENRWINRREKIEIKTVNNF